MKITKYFTFFFFLAAVFSFVLAGNPTKADGTSAVYSGLPEGVEYDGSNNDIMDDFDVNIGSSFTLAATVRMDAPAGCQVIFAKGQKVSGHYELWFLDNQFAFFAPEINGGQAIYTNIRLDAGKVYSVIFTYSDGEWNAYLNGVLEDSGGSFGTVSPSVAEFAAGALVDGTYGFDGLIKDIRIYDSALDAKTINEIWGNNDMKPTSVPTEKPTQEPEVPESFPYKALTEGKTYTGKPDITKKFGYDLENVFTLAATVQVKKETSTRVLFAKGPKTAGHYELWISDQGEFAFYAPEINGNSAIYTGINITDDVKHHVAFVYNEGEWFAYLDGYAAAEGVTDGAISRKTANFALGGLPDGTFVLNGYLADVLIDNKAYSDEEILAIASVKNEHSTEYEPAKHESTYTPVKYQPKDVLRGSLRLAEPAALPLIDLSATTGYSGSIDKQGGNADWDWGIYQDENGEWVLFEQYGPGCIYNFTQHRYPTSKEPTFKFYIDGSDTPAFEIKQSEFGKKEPVTWPIGGYYEGPSDGGRGPIWVVRNFAPMYFNTYCKVTSTVKLEGNDKAAGQGGWGHVMYVLFDEADGTASFKSTDKDDVLISKADNLTFDPKYNAENEKVLLNGITVSNDAPVEVLNVKGSGSVAAVKIVVEGKAVKTALLSDIRIRMYWDGETEPSVDAPIGTFFGNEYGATDCDNTLYMLGTEIKVGKYFRGYNYYPMPYWDSARIEIYNTGKSDIVISSLEIETTPSSVVSYDKAKTGYFVSSKYYEPTKNTAGKNSVIAEVAGTGHMVYGVLSGYGIGSGCEGDVRVFFDGRESPEVESDGSESWASYGWGFVTPPQSNPFSGYNGAWNSNSNWSEVRLTVGDSYFFRTYLRFELEHGGANEGMGRHSGQIFCYVMKTESGVTDEINLDDADSRKSHNYTGEETSRKLKSAYANGINTANTFEREVFYTGKPVSFTVNISADNTGIMINRTGDQKDKRQAARVSVDGVEVTERIWYAADGNQYYRWRDDSFTIPGKYTAGKTSVTVTITPLDEETYSDWNAACYEIISIVNPAGQNPGNPGEEPTDAPSEITTDAPDTGKTDKKQSSTVLPFVIGGIGLIAVIAAIIIVIKRKKANG